MEEDDDGGGNRGVGARVWDKGAGLVLRGEERATGATGRVAGEEGSRRWRDCGRRRTWVEPRCEDSRVTHRPTLTAPGEDPTHPSPIAVKTRSHPYQ